MWYAMDIIEFGVSQPSISDTIVSLMLAKLITDKFINKE